MPRDYIPSFQWLHWAHLCCLPAVFFNGLHHVVRAWSVVSSRNRANCQRTTLKHTRNVLRLITALTLERRDAVSTVDPNGLKAVFNDCTGLNHTQ